MSEPILEARPALTPRLAGALRRRLRCAWSRLTRGDRRPPVEAALDWLLGLEIDGCLVEPVAPENAFTGTTAACIETASSYGCRAEAARWARWLVSIQHADGWLPALVSRVHGKTAQAAVRESPGSGVLPGRQVPCGLSTALAMKAFLTLAADLPELEEPARRACRHLRWLFDEDGRVQPTAEHPNLDDCWQAVLSLLPALQMAGRRWDDRTCRRAAERGGEVLLAGGLETGRSRPGFFTRYGGVVALQAQVLIDLGHLDAAAKLMEQINPCQSRDGSVRELLHRPHMTSEPQLTRSRTVAHVAVLWCRLGDRERADRALRYLERRQARDGCLPRYPRRRTSPRNAGDPEAVKHYLDAALLRVRAAFEDRWREFPDEIDPNDGRVQAVRAWVDALPADAKVADVGCGKGRFLKHLAEWFPGARLTGIDFSQAMLARLPSGVEAREGSLLRIPAADGEFDGALAVESLEHALVPERAVAELCRVVRPGGRVLVIDKHRAKQPLSEHDPWERWFLPEELARWLGRYCEDVAVEPVAHSEGRGGSDLFLAARGRR